MKEIVIMAGAANPEKRFLSFLNKLFPECAIRIVYAGIGIDRIDTDSDAQMSNKEMWKVV